MLLLHRSKSELGSAHAHDAPAAATKPERAWPFSPSWASRDKLSTKLRAARPPSPPAAAVASDSSGAGGGDEARTTRPRGRKRKKGKKKRRQKEKGFTNIFAVPFLVFHGASFMFGRCLTSTVWGIAADRIGRKPVVVFGIFFVVVFNTLFGLSVNYWMAIATRFLLGALNGLLGPIKAYAIEVCRPEHEALALSLVSTAWGIGLIIGPALGGYLAMPAEKFPNVFSPDSFFGRFPYFLPCLCTSVFAAVVLISCIWMPETLHKHKISENENQSVEALEAHLIDPKEKVEQSGSSDSKKSLFKNWPLMSSIIIYCVFSFHDMAYTEVFSLWAESDNKYGGLSLSSEDVGQVLAITGASLLVYQLFIYPRINKVLGLIKSSRIAAILCIPILFAYPYMTHLSGPGLSVILNIASVIKNNLAVTIITGTFILQNNAVPQDQRGAANGLSMTGMSLFKAFAPAGAGIVFLWAQKRQHAFFFPGDQMVFFLLNVVELLGLILTFKPFLAVPEQYDTN